MRRGWISPEGLRLPARTWVLSAPETFAPPVISRGLLYAAQNRADTISDYPPRLLCYELRANSKDDTEGRQR
ncbi:MAG: hypothetical protein VX911_09375 [Candidatus Latescibacterota bacterium]|nr:hypothetical protein [Candidatus Latescibacterota bacterium]